MRTIELGVAMTNAAADDDETKTIFCTPVARPVMRDELAAEAINKSPA
jgi:hypothetical protein